MQLANRPLAITSGKLYAKRNLSRAKLRGFTLVELMVVIAIIAILVGVGALAFGGALKRARDAKRKADLNEIRKALMMYYTESGSYPAMTDPLSGWERSACTATACNTDSPSPFMEYLSPNYMVRVPLDPQHPNKSGSWGYLYRPESAYGFRLMTHFEVLNNADDEDCYDPGGSGDSWWYCIRAQ